MYLYETKPHPENPDCTIISMSVQAKENAVGFATVIAVAEVMQEALNLVAAKSKGYGDAWRSQGWMGNLARVQSKTSRLKNMLWCSLPHDSTKEPVEDTLLDLMNLSVFMLINKRNANQWGN